MNFFTGFFQHPKRYQQLFQGLDHQRQDKGRDAAQIEHYSQGGEKAHEYAQLALPQAHTQIKHAAQGAQAKQGVRRGGGQSQTAAKGPQHIIGQPQPRAEKHGAESLGELLQGIVFHQWNSLAQRLRLTCTSS